MVALPNVNAIELRDVSHKTFKIFLGWLWMEYLRIKDREEDYWLLHADYSQWNDHTVDCEYGDFNSLDPLYWEFEDQSASTWKHAEVMVNIYFFAKTFDIPLLQEDAQDRLVWCHNMAFQSGDDGEYFPTGVIKRVYEETTRDNGLRRLLVWGWCELVDESDKVDDRQLAELPKDFLAAALKYTIEWGEDGCHSLMECDYHGHFFGGGKGTCTTRVDDIFGY